METLIVHPDTKEKTNALKAVLKALKIDFEKGEGTYNPDFIAKIKEGKEDIKSGRATKITLDDIWK